MAFFTERAKALAMEVEDCPLSDLAPDWTVDGDSLRRSDGKFFKVRGRRVKKIGGREIAAWGQPLIFGEPEGTVALIVEESTNDVLVRVKAEPGADGYKLNGINTGVLVSPPLQFSQSNLEHHKKAKRGDHDGSGNVIKPIPLADILEDGRFRPMWDSVPEDPGRFADKRNRNGLVMIPAKSDLADDFVNPKSQSEDFCWVNVKLMRQIRAAGWANSHLRSVLSMLA